MAQLSNSNGDILIPGISDDVAPLTDEECATYKTIDFDIVLSFYILIIFIIH